MKLLKLLLLFVLFYLPSMVVSQEKQSNIDRINDHAYFKQNGVLVVNNVEHIHHASWGQYWTKYYNTDYNDCADGSESDIECKSTSVTIKDFKIFEKIVL